MKSVRLSEVPEYLRKGAFYQSLDLSNDEEIQVPHDVVKPNANIWVDSQLADYLRSLRYWGVPDISYECTEFVLVRDQFCMPAVNEFTSNFPTLTLLNELLRTSDKTARLRTAIERNSLNVVRGMLSVGYEMIGGACDIAAQLPTSSILELLHSKNGAVSFTTVKKALSAGNIEAVRYLDMQGLGMKDHIADIEVITTDGRKEVIVGNLACFIYALENGCIMNVFAIKNFAANNKLDILKYAHEQGYPWDENTTIAAATHGALACLKYAYEHGCPTTIATYTAARVNHQEACRAYLTSRGIFP